MEKVLQPSEANQWEEAFEKTLLLRFFNFCSVLPRFFAPVHYYPPPPSLYSSFGISCRFSKPIPWGYPPFTQTLILQLADRRSTTRTENLSLVCEVLSPIVRVFDVLTQYRRRRYSQTLESVNRCLGIDYDKWNMLFMIVHNSRIAFALALTAFIHMHGQLTFVRARLEESRVFFFLVIIFSACPPPLSVKFNPSHSVE